MIVCREIIACPIVHQLRGALQLSRILYCETSSERCALRELVESGKPIPPGMLPDGCRRELPVPG